MSSSELVVKGWPPERIDDILKYGLDHKYLEMDIRDILVGIRDTEEPLDDEDVAEFEKMVKEAQEEG